MTLDGEVRRLERAARAAPSDLEAGLALCRALERAGSRTDLYHELCRLVHLGSAEAAGRLFAFTPMLRAPLAVRRRGPRRGTHVTRRELPPGTTLGVVHDDRILASGPGGAFAIDTVTLEEAPLAGPGTSGVPLADEVIELAGGKLVRRGPDWGVVEECALRGERLAFFADVLVVRTEEAVAGVSVGRGTFGRVLWSRAAPARARCSARAGGGLVALEVDEQVELCALGTGEFRTASAFPPRPRRTWTCVALDEVGPVARWSPRIGRHGLIAANTRLERTAIVRGIVMVRAVTRDAIAYVPRGRRQLFDDLIVIARAGGRELWRLPEAEGGGSPLLAATEDAIYLRRGAFDLASGAKLFEMPPEVAAATEASVHDGALIVRVGETLLRIADGETPPPHDLAPTTPSVPLTAKALEGHGRAATRVERLLGRSDNDAPTATGSRWQHHLQEDAGWITERVWLREAPARAPALDRRSATSRLRSTT